MASEKRGSVGMEGVIKKYPHLFSPLKIRNKILKNRILHTPGIAGLLSGPEKYPNDHTRFRYSQLARNAAIVTVKAEWGDGFGQWEDIPSVHMYLAELIENIHSEDSLACVGKLQGGTVEEAVTKAKEWEDSGYDLVEIGERSWSGIEAVRADLDKMEAIRKETNLLIEAVILPCSPGRSRGPAMMGGGMPAMEGGGMPAMGGFQMQSGYSDAKGPELEELLAMVKMIDGLADVLRMKDVGHATNHPNSFSMEKDKPWMLRFAQAIKESGAKIITAPTGGFHDPALNDEWIRSGKCDMVGMCTPIQADPEWVKKAYEGRPEDIVPCVKCHDCHGPSAVCPVNPTLGLSETIIRSIPSPFSSRRVAVIGGGPGGMKAAIVAAERGHKVTLYEKSDTLGGQQQHTDFTTYKWTYKDFKDYLIRQIYKAGVEVRLKTTATPDMIKAKGFDTVLVAIGADPIIPKIPGVDGKDVYNIVDVYRNKRSLGKNVVIIGAGVFGTETGICLALEGYKVTVLTSEKHLIPPEVIGAHNKQIQMDLAQNHKNFSFVLEATTCEISGGKVTYRDVTGSKKSVRADSVVVYAGFSPRMDEAMKFSGSAGQVLLLGDCTGNAGTLPKTIRSAFFKASQV